MTPLDHALAYARLGLAVFPLNAVRDGRCGCPDPNCPPKNAGKHPHGTLAPRGFHDASTDETAIRRWWGQVPDANIGIATGQVSGIAVLDVDPRNGGDDTLHVLERKHGKLPDTAVQLTGGGGLHYVFKRGERRMKSPGKGIDAKDDGGYIVAAPSMHGSGKRYEWEASADLLEGFELAELPEWLLAPEQSRDAGFTTNGVGYLHPQRIADLRAALGSLDAADYGLWINVGQALHATEAAESFDLWDEWSKTTPNYDGSTERKWRTFRAGGGLHVESIFAWARDAGWDGVSQTVPVPIASVPVKVAPLQLDGPPQDLLELPGVLGEFVDWCNATAPKPQPQFAVQAALALAGVVLGRRWKTTKQNYACGYFINIGKSASGKEHARTCIDRVLTDAGLAHLIGGTGYTSDSAVFSALHQKPEHISIIDEIGAMLGNSKAQGNFYKRQSFDLITQVWGLAHSTIRPQQYSANGLTAQQREERAKMLVHRPSLTILGMSTPQTFWRSMDESSIEGGFLNRMFVVESNIGRRKRGAASDASPPSSVIQWCQAAYAVGGGNLAGIALGPDLIPEAMTVEFEREADAMLDAYEGECIASMDGLDAEGLAEMEGRSHEKALRLALVFAVSDNIQAPVIHAQHAAKSIRYTRHYTGQTIDAIRKHMVGSPFGEWRRAVIEVIDAGGAKGRTERELAMYCRPFASLEPRQRRAVLDSLKNEDRIAFVDMGKSPSGRGRSRAAWVAIESDDDITADKRRQIAVASVCA